MIMSGVADIEYVEFLGVLAKGIGKKHKREICLSCDLTGLLNRQSISGGSCYQIATNDKKLFQKSRETLSDCWIDKDFKKKLRSNIKNHLPEKLYNYLVMRSLDEESNLKDLLNYSGWEVLELLLETVSHESDFRRFFVNISNDKLEIIPTERHNKTNIVKLDW
jgi:hypothetical protein